MSTPYAELQVTTNFSFLRGASSADELFAAAHLLGYEALGVADRGSLAGIVRAHAAAKATGVRLIVGCRLDLGCGASLLVYPQDRPAYSRLTRLLTVGKARAGKGGCHLAWPDIAEWGEGMVAVLVEAEPDETLAERLQRLRGIFRRRAYLALTRRFRPDDHPRLDALEEIAAAARVPTVATNDVLFHTPERRILQDVVTCIRLGCTVDELGFRRERHADRFLKPPSEMARLFARHEAAVARTQDIVARCPFSLAELDYQYPEEAILSGLTPQEALERRTWEGAAWRYPEGVPELIEARLRHELALINEMKYAPYFLTVDAIVRFARTKKILCQGRGSAANSAVCYVLAITSINPAEHDLLFERFVSTARDEPPDIDVDFEHDRREEIIQWIYATYGHDRAALAATVIRYRARGAVREVGKALGLPEDLTSALAAQASSWSVTGVSEAQARELNLNVEDHRLKLTLALAGELIGFPRHLSQHPGGFVLTRDRLDDLVPIEPASMPDRRIVEWNKDDLDELGFMKVDVLGLGMLGVLRRSFDRLAAHRGQDLDIAKVPSEDPAVYDMICAADTIGVFQIESRAQMAMLPRMKPSCLYDLTIEVAIVRPGPIQGDMVHPYLKRREGREKPEYPTPELRAVLYKTLGVPLFQEQAMNVAIRCAGFTPAEADQLRRSMATFKSTGGVSVFRDKLIDGMVARGHPQDFAERCFRQLEGFGSYGFPESHAASFALLAYASSWVKRRHPDIFLAALIDSQPMGFYAPAQLVRDAREHGVEVRPIDVNASEWFCTLEEWGAAAGQGRTPREERAHPHAPPPEELAPVRLGMKLVKGLSQADAERLAATRAAGPYSSVEALARRAGLSTRALECLADADAFRSLGLARRDALWAVQGLREGTLPLFEAGGLGAAVPELDEPPVALKPMSAGREVVEDYRSQGLSLRAHPLAFLRETLSARGILPASCLTNARDGARVTVAGLVLMRQKPGSAKGTMFITLEDETGIANLVVWPAMFETSRRTILGARMLGCAGRVQRAGLVVHLIAERLVDLSAMLRAVGEGGAAERLRYEKRASGGPDRSDLPPFVPTPRDIDAGPGRAADDGIKIKTRDFR